VRAFELLVTREILQLPVALQFIDLSLLLGVFQLLLGRCALVGGGEKVASCRKRGTASRKIKRE